MTKEKTTQVAEQILEDRKGADYYKDTKILADYLKNALDISLEAATNIAEDIQADRQGANYYADVKILTGFLNRKD